MKIYIILLLIIILLYIFLFKVFKLKYSKEIFCGVVFILLTLVQGLRSWNVGNDTKNYVRFYEIVKTMSIKSILLQSNWVIEPGYGMLMKVCSLIGINTRFFILIVAMIINGGLMLFIYKYSENPLMSVIIFMGVEFFTLSFTALRQMIAVIIVLNSYTFIRKEKYIKFIIIILLAATFHKSALIFLPVYFFKNIKISKNNLIIGGCLILLLQVCAITIVKFCVEKFYYTSYLSADGSGITQAFVMLVYLVLGILIYFKFIDKNEYKDNILFFVIYVAFAIQSLTYQLSMLSRLMWYFYIFIVIFLPNVISNVKGSINIIDKKISIKRIVSLCIYFLMILQYLLFSINMYNIIPYSFFNCI